MITGNHEGGEELPPSLHVQLPPLDLDLQSLKVSWQDNLLEGVLNTDKSFIRLGLLMLMF